MKHRFVRLLKFSHSYTLKASAPEVCSLFKLGVRFDGTLKRALFVANAYVMIAK